MATATYPTRLGTCLVAAVIAVVGSGCGIFDEFPLAANPIAGVITPWDNTCGTPDNSEELVAELIRLVNEERASQGLDPVSPNPVLTAVAADYACTMIEDGYFGHYHPETSGGPGKRAAAAGYHYQAVGENLAGGQKTPAEVIEDWMNSTGGHRENILNPMWVHVGIAVRTGGKYGTYWVQEFGAPWSDDTP